MGYPVYYANSDLTVFYVFSDRSTAIKVMLNGGVTSEDFGIISMHSLDDTYYKGVSDTCTIIHGEFFNDQYSAVLKKQVEQWLSNGLNKLF